MSQPPLYRQRPNLHVTVKPMTGSPLGTTAYSPFRSAGLISPIARSRGVSPKPRRHGSRNRYYRRLFASKTVRLAVLLLILLIWWFTGGRKELDAVKIAASGMGNVLVQERRMQDYRFFPASNPKIHYMGRWTSTPNRLRKDGTFPGVYFDVTISNTSTLLLALHNDLERLSTKATNSSSSSLPDPKHFSFRPLSTLNKPALPISLLARIDDQEYVLLPNSSLLATVCLGSLDPSVEHHVRIVAPMIDDHGQGVVEFEGLWLSKGGKLSRVPGSSLDEEYADEDQLRAENDVVGEKHRTGLRNIDDQGAGRSVQLHLNDEEEVLRSNQERRRILEVITDSPGSITRKQRRRSGGADGLLSGVMGWEYLLGEMFAADHVGIGVDGMCLIQDCFGGIGYPAGVGDIFFRSGPYGSEYFQHSWIFNSYVPDVIILNLGVADNHSFATRQQDYNKDFFDLSARFEATYVSLIRGIRRLAYPKHPAITHSERLGFPGIIPSNTPAAIPIFVMRPFRGQLEQATQNVVSQMRANGDKSVFWLDTSGWLDPNPESSDFFLDETSSSSTSAEWRLTEQGNQRAAIFLHMHVCRYLAAAEESCPFLPQEVYQGKVFDPKEANFDRYLENEKERRLRKIFWEDQKEEDANMKAKDPQDAVPT